MIKSRRLVASMAVKAKLKSLHDYIRVRQCFTFLHLTNISKVLLKLTILAFSFDVFIILYIFLFYNMLSLLKFNMFIVGSNMIPSLVKWSWLNRLTTMGYWDWKCAEIWMPCLSVVKSCRQYPVMIASITWNRIRKYRKISIYKIVPRNTLSVVVVKFHCE